MKKLGIAIGALVLLAFAAMVIIPLVVDVDKYRPQIVSAANENLNGKLELGHLKLSLWGHVSIEADGLTLKDAQGTNIVSVKDASFYLPFFPLLTGSPVVNLEMDSPVVNVVKSHAGKLNVMTLMKTAEVSSGAAAPTSTAKEKAPTEKAAAPSAPAPQATQQAEAKPQVKGSVAVPAIAARARLGFQLTHALLSYKDEASGMKTELKDFNIVAKDVSLSHASEISVWSDFDTQMGTTSVKGPGRIDLKFTPEIAGGTISKFTVAGNANFDALEIVMPGTFEKKKDVPANMAIALSGTPKDVSIDRADVHFFNAEIRSHGTVSNLDSNPTVQYELKSNEIELRSWTELLPMLKEYQLGGKAMISANVGGPAEKISYQAKVAVTDLTAKAPKLKAEPRIDGEIDIATDQIENIRLTMKAPGNDLEVRGKMLSFKAPQLTLDVTSSGMDLDQLIDFAPPAKTASVDWITPAYAEATEKAAADFDALLEPLRSNKMLAATAANVNFDLKMLKVQNARMSNVVGKVYFKDLGAGLQNFSMGLFNGTVKASASSQLRPRQPTYKFSAQVNGLDLSEAVKSQVSMFKDTVVGKANFEITGEGSSFNPETAKQNLKAKGSMKITNAEFTSIDVGKMVTEGLNGAISKVAGKVPGLAGKKINGLPNGTSKYELISSDFGISGGSFSAPNFVAKAMPNQGIDLKGVTSLGMKDMSVKANWEVIDTYNLTHAKDINVNIGGADVPHVLAENGKPVIFPVSVGCTLKSPCYSYTEVPEYLGKVAMNNVAGGAKSRVKTVLTDQIQKALGGGGGKLPNVGGALKSLFGH